MVSSVSRWFERSLNGLQRQIQLFVDGISGQDRRINRELRQRIETLQIRLENLQRQNQALETGNKTLAQQLQALQSVSQENQRLKQEMQQLTLEQRNLQATAASWQSRFQVANSESQRLTQQNQQILAERDNLQRIVDSEIQLLKNRNYKLSEERDDLQLKVWEQAEQIEELHAENQDGLQSAIDQEIQQVKKRNLQLLKERDDFQLKVWEQEQQITELLDYIAQTGEDPEADELTDDSSLSEIAQTVDLSALSLALLGGHGATRRGVIETLSAQHGLKQWVEIPPFSNISAGRNKVKAKVQSCDLIVVITGYMSHKLTNNIQSLKESGALTGDVLLLSCRGKSGVIREVLNYVTQKQA